MIILTLQVILSHSGKKSFSLETVLSLTASLLKNGIVSFNEGTPKLGTPELVNVTNTRINEYKMLFLEKKKCII